MNATHDSEEFYKKQLLSKDSEIKRLRDYIEKLETLDVGIRQELESQLKDKSLQVEKLLALSKGNKIKMQELHDAQLAEKGMQLEKLREKVASTDDDRLLRLLKSKDDENKRLSRQLEEKISAEREYAEKLKRAIEKKGRSTKDIVNRLSDEVERKNSELDRLRNVILAQEKLIKQLDNQSIEDRKQIQYMETYLEEKDIMREKLELNFNQQLRNKEKEFLDISRELKREFNKKNSAKLPEEVASLKAKLEVKASELEELSKNYAEIKQKNDNISKRLQERQRMFVESESTYNKMLSSVQKQHEDRIREIMRKNSERELQLKSEIEKLKSDQEEKQALVAEKEIQIDQTLLQFAETSRRLIELKDGGDSGVLQLKERETAMKKKEEELKQLLQQAQQRIQDALRKETDIARREALLIKEQEALSSELDVLKKAGIEIGKDREFLKEKISSYAPQADTSPHEEVPEPALEDEAPVAEEAEQLQELDAPVSQPRTLSTPKEEREDVLKLLRTGPEVRPKSDLLNPAKPKQRKGVFKQAKSRSKLLPKPIASKIKAKVDRPKLKAALVKKAENEDSFPEASGYSEIEEIKSVIHIGLQHNDSIEKIRHSLENSGYSKKNIDAAFKEVPVVS